jgi:hypothetical protein
MSSLRLASVWEKCACSAKTRLNQDLRGVVPRDNKTLTVRFLFWWLKSIADTIVAEGTGATVQGVKLPFIKSLQIPVAPLAEQQRIVGILDEAFEGIATTKANAEKNIQNSRAIFESHLQSVFTFRGKAWEKQSLASLCALFVDSAHRTPKYKEEGIPALRPRDVVNGKLNLVGALRVSEVEFEIQSKRYKPSPGDIVYPPDFFDFIVIDECHRGGANDESNWRGILEYFRGAYHDRHERGMGCGGRGSARAHEMIAGRVSRERSQCAQTNDAEADGEVVWS